MHCIGLIRAVHFRVCMFNPIASASSDLAISIQYFAASLSSPLQIALMPMVFVLQIIFPFYFIPTIPTNISLRSINCSLAPILPQQIVLTEHYPFCSIRCCVSTFSSLFFFFSVSSAPIIFNAVLSNADYLNDKSIYN